MSALYEVSDSLLNSLPDWKSGSMGSVGPATAAAARNSAAAAAAAAGVMVAMRLRCTRDPARIYMPGERRGSRHHGRSLAASPSPADKRSLCRHWHRCQ